MPEGGATVLTKADGTVLLVAGGGGGANISYDGLNAGNGLSTAFLSQYPPQNHGSGGGGYTAGMGGRNYSWITNLRVVRPDSEIKNPDGTYKYFRPEWEASPHFRNDVIDTGDIRNYDTAGLNSTGMVGEYEKLIRGSDTGDFHDSSTSVPGYGLFYQLNESDVVEAELFSGYLYSDYYDNSTRFAASCDIGIGTSRTGTASSGFTYGLHQKYVAEEWYDVGSRLLDCANLKVCLDESWIEIWCIDESGVESLYLHKSLRDILSGGYTTKYISGSYPEVHFNPVDSFTASVYMGCNGNNSNMNDPTSHIAPHNPVTLDSGDWIECVTCYLNANLVISVNAELPEGTKAVGIKQHKVSYKDKAGEGCAIGLNSGMSVYKLQLLCSGYGAEAGASYNASTVTDVVETVGANSSNGYAKITQLHSHTYTSEITTQPTCTEKGIRTYTCTGTTDDAGCGDTYTEEVDALGHNEDSGSVTTEPTCTEKGVKTFKCTRCSTVLRTEDIDALGHNKASNWSYESNNSIENGRAYKNCTRCGINMEQKFMLVIESGVGTKDVTVGGTYYYKDDSVIVSSGINTGYHWSGWEGDMTSTDNPYTFSMPEKAVKLKAVALPNEYTIEYVN